MGRHGGWLRHLLTSDIIKIRDAFGDDSCKPWHIEILSQKGYRLIARVIDAQTDPPRHFLIMS